jgi:DNA-binding response OmpR family regulator
MAQIIIVDDEVEILAPLEQMLAQEGYHVSAFSSSLAAQAHLQRHSADLAIFDIKMPEMDGFSLLKSVRAKMPNLPIIFLSSKAEEQDQIIGFTLGADDYITKPFSKHLLLFRVAAVLRRHTVGTGVNLDAAGVQRGAHHRPRSAFGNLGKYRGGFNGDRMFAPARAGPASRCCQNPKPADGCGLSRSDLRQ